MRVVYRAYWVGHVEDNHDVSPSEPAKFVWFKEHRPAHELENTSRTVFLSVIA
jgi:hypothetical protein